MDDDIAEIVGAGAPDDDDDDSPRGKEAWKEQSKAIERVISVALTLDRPRTADWVADEAAVSPQTARGHLGSLSELGIVAETTARGVTKYQIDAAYTRFREVSQYIERYEKDELIDVVKQTKERITTAKDRYGVDAPDELRAKTTHEDTPTEDIEEYKKAASEWETFEYRLDVLEEAIERYDEFSRTEVTA
ncbi:MAG: ArsR family transcriptional regulator [Halanaeroarchaeum sp.]